MTEYKASIIGDRGVYESTEAWQIAEEAYNYAEEMMKKGDNHEQSN